MRVRVIAWGVVAAALYVFTALVVQSAGQPVFPLFDGFAPPAPYQWVSPPPELAANNQPPLPGVGEVSLKGAAQNFFATTDDGQASLAGISDSFVRQPRQKTVRVNLTPLDPQTLGPPPRGLVFDGNAYQIEAAYAPSGNKAKLKDDVQVILRYPRHATVVLASTGSGWQRVTSFPVRPSSTIYIETPELGTFVTARPPPPPPEQSSSLPWIAFGSAGVAVVTAGVAFYLRKRARARRRRRRKKPPAKRKRR